MVDIIALEAMPNNRMWVQVPPWVHEKDNYKIQEFYIKSSYL